MFALLVVLAVAALLAWLKARLAPEPVYDWPVWAYRVALALRYCASHVREGAVSTWTAVRVLRRWRPSAW